MVKVVYMNSIQCQNYVIYFGSIFDVFQKLNRTKLFGLVQIFNRFATLFSVVFSTIICFPIYSLLLVF
jgi:hypothetical protein